MFHNTYNLPQWIRTIELNRSSSAASMPFQCDRRIANLISYCIIFLVYMCTQIGYFGQFTYILYITFSSLTYPVRIWSSYGYASVELEFLDLGILEFWIYACADEVFAEIFVEFNRNSNIVCVAAPIATEHLNCACLCVWNWERKRGREKVYVANWPNY